MDRNGVAGFEFREILPDAGEYLALFETTGWNREYNLGAEELHAALARSWYLVTVYDCGRLVATGRVISDGAFHGLIVDVIVHPGYRARGIGSAVMRRLLERCRRARIRDVQLFCARGKAPFYRRFGFIDRPDDAPGMDFRPKARPAV